MERELWSVRKRKTIVYNLDMRIQYEDKETARVAHFTTLKEIHTFIGDLIENNIDIVKMEVVRLDKNM